jgi:uncharacterized protein YjiS (DUF1127 family)
LAEASWRGGCAICGMTMIDIAACFAIWLRRARTRRHLRALEAHRLADIGLSEGDRCREGSKWFWQI